MNKYYETLLLVIIFVCLTVISLSEAFACGTCFERDCAKVMKGTCPAGSVGAAASNKCQQKKIHYPDVPGTFNDGCTNGSTTKCKCYPTSPNGNIEPGANPVPNSPEKDVNCSVLVCSTAPGGYSIVEDYTNYNIGGH